MYWNKEFGTKEYWKAYGYFFGGVNFLIGVGLYVSGGIGFFSIIAAIAFLVFGLWTASKV